MKQYTLHTGDNREVLKTLDDNSIDSIVTDPPYELGFMGKKWDASGIAYNVDLWKECLRVLKPGGHLLAFGGSRTYHRLAVAIENAGFEVRDCIMWLYGSGFPKGLNISKQIDKMLDATPEIISTVEGKKSTGSGVYNWNKEEQGTHKPEYHITKPSSELAKQWDGWNTALKPAHEPIVMARKPLECFNVAENVMKWNVGGINVDGCRVGQRESEQFTGAKKAGTFAGELQDSHSEMYEKSSVPLPDGRWPANIILDEEAAQMLDEQSGVSKSSVRPPLADRENDKRGTWQMSPRKTAQVRGHSDSGGASRFFYVAKASKAEREAGLEGMEQRKAGAMTGAEYREDRPTNHPIRANHHPTVKPIALMRYLVRMVTPNNGIVLDPFMGSGTTGCAAMLEAVRFIGIELNEEYSGIAERRIRYWLSTNMAKE
jgi:DNA modification methylase